MAINRFKKFVFIFLTLIFSGVWQLFSTSQTASAATTTTTRQSSSTVAPKPTPAASQAPAAQTDFSVNRSDKEGEGIQTGNKETLADRL
ncbi:MAG: hypothetical protein CEN91_564, partial [Candidatus Berkelbacteria bacterium Licking1014_85]